MQAVILAAGVGTRLGRPFPKSLSVLPTGERILGRQIRLLREIGIKHITVVVGFKMDLIMEEFPGVFYCYNPIYYVTNTAKSLLCALNNLEDDVLWMNGDVVFDPEILQKMLAVKEEKQSNLVCVDNKRCAEEEVKYTVDSDGYINAISKQVNPALGEALGINLISKESLPSFITALEQCGDMDYFEKGLELIIHKGHKLLPLDISGHRCIEVDFNEDWEATKKMFAEG